MIINTETWARMKAYPTTHAWCLVIVAILLTMLVLGFR